MAEEKLFPLEKILVLSLPEYCSMVVREPSDYIPIGVHAMATDGEDLRKSFQQQVPAAAEVVIAYREVYRMQTGRHYS